VLYEMLALRRLFQRNTDYLTFRAVMEQPIPDVRRYRPDVPDSLVNVLMHALERDPNNRFETARQLGTAVLDAMSPARPWSQGEIADFVKHEFAAEMHKRQQQVHGIVTRTAVGRSTMPMLAHGSEANEGDGDDEGFPSVETEVDSAPKWTPQPAPARAGQSADFAVGGTPPPFGGETNPSQPSLVPLQSLGMPTQGPGTVVVVNKRNLVWPLLAVAFLAVAGGALFLVYRQMQQQQPSVVNITSTSDNSTQHMTSTTPIDAAVVVDEPAPADAAAVVVRPPPTNPRHHRAATYDAAIAERKPELATCINDHKDALPTGVFKAIITVGASGRAKSVGFDPENVSSTPLGSCIRNVLTGAEYPTAPADITFRVPLHVGS
jgi:hypothetical protein